MSRQPIFDIILKPSDKQTRKLHLLMIDSSEFSFDELNDWLIDNKTDSYLVHIGKQKNMINYFVDLKYINAVAKNVSDAIGMWQFNDTFINLPIPPLHYQKIIWKM